MPRDASELARRIARDAEAVCRHYLIERTAPCPLLDGGRRSQHARLVDVRPAQRAGIRSRRRRALDRILPRPIRPPPDVYRESCGFIDFRDVVEEARRFLSLPRAEPGGSQDAVSRPLPPDRRKRHGGSLPSRGRSGGLPSTDTCATAASGTCATRAASRFHPRCYYRPEGDGPRPRPGRR